MSEKKYLLISCFGNGASPGLGGGLVRCIAVARVAAEQGHGVLVCCSSGVSPYFEEFLSPQSVFQFDGGWPSRVAGQLFGMRAHLLVFHLEVILRRRGLLVSALDSLAGTEVVAYTQSEYFWDVVPLLKLVRSRRVSRAVVMTHHYLAPRFGFRLSLLPYWYSVCAQRLGVYLAKQNGLLFSVYSGYSGDLVRQKLSLPSASVVTEVENGVWVSEMEEAFTRSVGTLPEYDLCFVGGLREGKGLDLFDRFCTYLQANEPQLKVVIIGNQPLSVTEKFQALFPDTVIFTGGLERSATLRIISRSRLAFSPSTTEGFGIFLIEALVMRKHVVSLPLPEVRTRFGGDVLYSDECSGESLARKCCQVLSDAGPCNGQPEMVAKKIGDRFDWGRVLAEEIKLYLS